MIDRIGSPEINFQMCQQGCQDHSMGKGQSFQQMLSGKLNIDRKRMHWNPYLIPHTKINLKLIKDSNLRAKTTKHRRNLHDLGFHNGFLSMTPKVQATTRTKK